MGGFWCIPGRCRVKGAGRASNVPGDKGDGQEFENEGHDEAHEVFEGKKEGGDQHLHPAVRAVEHHHLCHGQDKARPRRMRDLRRKFGCRPNEVQEGNDNSSATEASPRSFVFFTFCPYLRDVQLECHAQGGSSRRTWPLSLRSLV